MGVAFDKAVDYAQKVIDLTRAGAPDYQIVEAMAQRKAKQESGYGTQYMDNQTFSDIMGLGKYSGSTAGGAIQPTVNVTGVDDNGIAKVSVAGYDPANYSAGYTAPSSSGSSGISNILGYVVIGLIGIALLDRFMNSSGGKK